MSGGDPKEKAEEFLKQMRDNQSVRADDPNTPVKLDAKTFEYLKEHGEIIELSKSEVQPVYK